MVSRKYHAVNYRVAYHLLEIRGLELSYAADGNGLNHYRIYNNAIRQVTSNITATL
jgi:hypothetical protein